MFLCCYLFNQGFFVDVDSDANANLNFMLRKYFIYYFLMFIGFHVLKYRNVQCLEQTIREYYADDTISRSKMNSTVMMAQCVVGGMFLVPRVWFLYMNVTGKYVERRDGYYP